MDPTYAARSAPPPASGAWCVRLDRHIADDSPLALLPFDAMDHRQRRIRPSGTPGQLNVTCPTTESFLWHAEDSSAGTDLAWAARDLMRALYSALARGIGRAQALRQAKLALLRQPRFSHPYYWPLHRRRGLHASRRPHR